MKVIHSQESIQAAVKRDNTTTDLYTWHWRLGNLGNSMLKKLVGNSSVKGMEVTNTHLPGICGNCIMGKMDENHSRTEQIETHRFLEPYMLT